MIPLKSISFCGELLALFIAGSIFGLALIYFSSVDDTLSEFETRNEQALALWLKDCAAMNRPIDDCARAWNITTLREIYYEKLAK